MLQTKPWITNLSLDLKLQIKGEAVWELCSCLICVSNNGLLLCASSFQLVRRVYKGIPLKLRGEVWCLLLDIPKIKEEKKDFYEVRTQPPSL